MMKFPEALAPRICELINAETGRVFGHGVLTYSGYFITTLPLEPSIGLMKLDNVYEDEYEGIIEKSVAPHKVRWLKEKRS